MQEFRKLVYKRGDHKLFRPFPERDQLHQWIFQVNKTFYYTVDENTQWGSYVICEATGQAYYIF